MKCPKCGYENPEEVSYCGLCYEVFRKEKHDYSVKKTDEILEFNMGKYIVSSLKSCFNEFKEDFLYFFTESKKNYILLIVFIVVVVLASIGLHYGTITVLGLFISMMNY